MLLGARQFFERRGGGGGWQNPYVTDGLVAMWDGEWNAGGGVHDASATTWVDLSGNGYDISIPSAGASWSNNRLSLASASVSCSLPQVSRQSFTIEYVGSGTGGGGAFVWMKNPSWVGGALLGWNSGGSCWYPWASIGSLGDLKLQSASLSWSADGQKLVRDGSVIANTSGAIDGRNYLTTVFLGEYSGAILASMDTYCVRLYSRSITIAEIAANYAIDKARFNLT